MHWVDLACHRPSSRVIPNAVVGYRVPVRFMHRLMPCHVHILVARPNSRCVGTHSCSGLALHSRGESQAESQAESQTNRPSIVERACRGSERGRRGPRCDHFCRQSGSECLRTRKSRSTAFEAADRAFSEHSRSHRPDRLTCPESPVPRRARPRPRQRCGFDFHGWNGGSPGFAVGRPQAPRGASGTGASPRK